MMQETASSDGGAVVNEEEVEGAAAADGAVAGGVDLDADFVKPEDAGFELDDELLCQPADDIVHDDEGSASQLHRALPGPRLRLRRKFAVSILPIGLSDPGAHSV